MFLFPTISRVCSPPSLGSKQLTEATLSPIVSSWLEEVQRRQNSNPEYQRVLDTYVTDTGMDALRHYRLGTMTPSDTKLLQDVNRVIQAMPPLPEDIDVYRGFHGYESMERHKTRVAPFSASFLSQYAKAYVEQESNCCLLKIKIPAGTKVAFHRAEGQLILSGNNFVV